MSHALPAAGRQSILSRDFVLTCLSFFAFYSSYYLLMPIVPLYVVRLGGSESEVGLAVGAFMISSLLVRPFAGRAVDVHGKRFFLAGGSLVFIAAELLYFAANSAQTLLAVRIVHGIALGIFVTSIYAVVADLAPATRRGEAIGYFGFGSSFALTFGATAGIALLDLGDFSLVFVSAILMGVAALLCILRVRATHRAPGPAQGNGPLICKEAILPSVVGATFLFSYGGLVSFLPLYTRQYSIGNPGLFFTVHALAIIAVRLFSGRLSDRYGRTAVIAPGMVVTIVGLVVLMAARSIEAMMIAAVVYGAGTGLTIPPLQASVVDRTREGQRGAGMSMIGMSFDLGTGVGGVALGIALQAGGFDGMFLSSIAMTVAGLALLLLASRRGRTSRGARPASAVETRGPSAGARR